MGKCGDDTKVSLRLVLFSEKQRLISRHDATAMKELPINLGAIWKAAEEKKGDGWFNMAAGRVGLESQENSRAVA